MTSMPTLVSWRKNAPQPSERVLCTHILSPEQQVVSFLFRKMFRTPLLEEMDLKLIWTLPPSITIGPSPLHLPSWTKWIKFSPLVYCKHSNFDSGKVWEWGLSYHNSRFITLITATGSRIWITIIAFLLDLRIYWCVITERTINRVEYYWRAYGGGLCCVGHIHVQLLR